MTPGEIGGIERGKGGVGLRNRRKGTVSVARELLDIRKGRERVERDKTWPMGGMR